VNESKRSDQETQALIDLSKRETDRQKRLRKAAKSETLSLVQQLEQQHAFVQMVDAKIQTDVLPKASKMTSVAQEIEWNLDATLSALAMNTDDALFDELRESSSRQGRSVTLASAMDEVDDGMGIELPTTLPTQEQSMSRSVVVTSTSTMNSSTSASRSTRSMLSYEAKDHVDALESKLTALHEHLRDSQVKVNQICEYAVKHMKTKSVFTSATNAIYRMVEDCTDSRSGRMSAGPASNGVSGRLAAASTVKRLGGTAGVGGVGSGAGGHGNYTRISGGVNSSVHGDLT
jgi:hypothetical protein